MKDKKKKFDEIITGKHFHVTIFGSARMKKNDPRYKQIYRLASMIGERGIDVITGGGPGIMEAASLGHKHGKKKSKVLTHAVGLGIELPHEQDFNKGVNVTKTFDKFSARLDNFMKLSNVIVVAPGGVGTMLEFFYSWQLMQVNHICHIPIILFGDMWDGMIKWLEKEPLKKKFFEKKDMNLLFHAKSCEEAIEVIDKANEAFEKKDKNFCLNYNKYKLK
jgi:uncharacterized protein (TIGR00730 family)